MAIPIPVLFITYNRLAYSQRSLESVVQNAGVPTTITIIDNCSTDSTVEWLMSLDRDALGIDEIVFSEVNRGIAPAMNYFFKKYKDAQFVCKVDNDTVLPPNWLDDLLDVMTAGFAKHADHKFGAVSGTCLRPNGDTFDEWVRKYMVTAPFGDHFLHFNSYVCGTGVLINMDMIRARGLLFEKFPCKIAGWTDYTRIAAEFEGYKFAFYSKVPMTLLNLASEHVLSNDFPEYDAELKVVRDEGNAWWESVGGLSGVRKYIAEHGGLEPLVEDPGKQVQGSRRFLTHCDDRDVRSTPAYWQQRVQAVGPVRSTFLETPQHRIQAFTHVHESILKQNVPGRDVLDVGCGWGRMALTMSRMAKSYVGVDFVSELVDMARTALPNLEFHVADARRLPFPDQRFDVVTAIACATSFDAVFDEVLREFKRVLRPGGIVLFLEEEWARQDWKID